MPTSEDRPLEMGGEPTSQSATDYPALIVTDKVENEQTYANSCDVIEFCNGEVSPSLLGKQEDEDVDWENVEVGKWVGVRADDFYSWKQRYAKNFKYRNMNEDKLYYAYLNSRETLERRAPKRIKVEIQTEEELRENLRASKQGSYPPWLL